MPDSTVPVFPEQGHRQVPNPTVATIPLLGEGPFQSTVVHMPSPTCSNHSWIPPHTGHSRLPGTAKYPHYPRENLHIPTGHSGCVHKAGPRWVSYGLPCKLQGQHVQPSLHRPVVLGLARDPHFESKGWPQKSHPLWPKHPSSRAAGGLYALRRCHNLH